MELFWGCAPTIWSVRLIPKAWLFRKRFRLNPKFFFTSTINLKQVYLSRAGRLPVVISVEDTCNQKSRKRTLSLRRIKLPKSGINPPWLSTVRKTALEHKNYS
jgi:hypothetical protein